MNQTTLIIILSAALLLAAIVIEIQSQKINKLKNRK
jgi:hypothetical protein